VLVGVGRGTSSEGKLLQVEEEMGFQANSLMSSTLLNPQDLAIEYHCCFVFPRSLEICPKEIRTRKNLGSYQALLGI
jgi:hypothetical protein